MIPLENTVMTNFDIFEVTPCIPTHRRSSVNKCGKCIQMDGLSKIGLGTEVAVSKDCANFDGSLCSYGMKNKYTFVVLILRCFIVLILKTQTQECLREIAH